MSDLEVLSEDWDRALAVVAHPDDLEYGTASAVAGWTSMGKEVSYVLITRGEAGIDHLAPEVAGPLREDEERRSAGLVGVEQVEFLGDQDGVIEYGLSLRCAISRSIRRHRPEVLLSVNYRQSWGGRSFNMADHRHVGLALLDAARDAGNRWIFPELLEEGFEPWDGVTMACFNGSPEPTHYVDVTGHLERGIASLAAHETYLEAVRADPDSMLRSNAEALGAEVGCEHAVAFEVVEL